MTSAVTSLRLLLWADVRRLTGLLRHPSASTWLGLIVPAILLAVGVRAIGGLGTAQLQSTQDGVTLGVLVGGLAAFVAYTALFRGSDDAFLRRLGVPPDAL